MKKLLRYFLWAGLVQCAAAQPVHVSVIDSGMIFQNVPFASCHASTIVALRNNTVMAAWFGGNYEGNTDVRIYTAVYQNHHWSAPVIAATGMLDGQQYACWNPVLYEDSSGRLLLFYKVGASPRSWKGFVKISGDHGRSWSAATQLPEGYTGPVRTKPLQLRDGSLLFPSSTETEEGKWTIHIEKVSSRFAQGKKVLIDCDTFAAIQPAVVQTGKDTLQLLCRTRQNVIAESWSYDNGNSWTGLRSTGLPNPNSGIDWIMLKDGLQLLVYNPLVSGKDWWNGRAVLSLAMKKKNGAWENVLDLESHPDGEYSYPAIIEKGGIVWITYTYQRKFIKYVRLRVD